MSYRKRNRLGKLLLLLTIIVPIPLTLIMNRKYDFIGTFGADYGTMCWVCVYMGGVMFLLFALAILNTLRKMLVCTHVGRCTVVDVQETKDSKGSKSYKIYVDSPAGRILAKITSSKRKAMLYTPGTEINIKFNPRNYNDYSIGNSLWQVISFALFEVIALGMILLPETYLHM